MNRYLVVGIGGVLVLSVVLALDAQTTLLQMASVMTPQEVKASGVAGLSPDQRATLDQWLNRYTRRVIRATQSAAATDVPEFVTGKGHWVDEVCGDGAIVTLEDDSIWGIMSSDRLDTALWLATTDITVKRDPAPVGDYKYILVNTEDRENAHAKYLGRK